METLQKEGRRICFIGDGVNDTIALIQADVSISLRGASTIATDTAQIVFMEESGTVPSVARRTTLTNHLRYLWEREANRA